MQGSITMRYVSMSADRNFDELFERFRRNIKGSLKGRLREILIREDLEGTVPRLREGGLEVLDAGAGLGDLSVWLAGLGHRVHACDIAGKMVEHTRAMATELQVGEQVRAEQISIQELLARPEAQTYDLVCLHAVFEWMAEPYALLPELKRLLRPGSYLSLTVYNLHRAVFNSLVKGKFEMIAAGNYGGFKGLTPPQPILPERIQADLEALGFQIELQAGLRCFYDTLPPKEKAERTLEDHLLLERRYRKSSPYRDIARYVHFIARYPG